MKIIERSLESKLYLKKACFLSYGVFLLILNHLGTLGTLKMVDTGLSFGLSASDFREILTDPTQFTNIWNHIHINFSIPRGIFQMKFQRTNARWCSQLCTSKKVEVHNMLIQLCLKTRFST